MKSKLMLFAIIAMCLCMGTQVWANLLSNGDFELPGIQNDPATDWTHGGTNVGWNKTEDNGFAASIYGFHLVIGQGSACDGWAYQDVAASEDTQYQLTFDVGLDGWLNPACAGRIQFLDAVDAVISESSLDRDPAQATGDWVNYSFTAVAPTGTVTARVQMESIGGTGGTFRCDNVDFIALTDPQKTTNLQPSEGFVDPATSTLTWTNPTTAPDKHDIYFLESDTHFDSNSLSPFYVGAALDAMVPLYTARINGDLETYTVSLTEGKYYAWRILSDIVGQYASADVFFNAINTAASVEAGANSNEWLVSNTVDVNLDGTVDDADGYPGTAVTSTWTQTAGTDVSGSIVANGDDATVTITVADTYTFQLEADDGVDSATDTVTITVYTEADDRMVAHWGFENDLTESVNATDPTSETWLGKTPLVATDLDGIAGGVTAIDYSNGVLVDGVNPGQALHLDGTNWVDIDVDPNWLHYDNEITVTAWVRANGASFGSWQGIVAKGDSSWRIATNDVQSAQFANGHWQQDSGFYDPGSSQIISDGNWHHVAGVFDGSQMKIFVDGIADNSVATGTDPMTKNDYRIRIGSNSEGDATINADIDEVRIFDKGLSDARILAMYVDGGGGEACGQIYADSDFDQDCGTGPSDLLLLVAEWLSCTDLTGVNCN